MKIPKIFPLLLILLFFALCKKRETSEPTPAPPPPAPVPDTVRTFYKLDPATKPYYNFTDDSYWIYSDFAGNKEDSLHMSNFSFHIDTVIVNSPGKINIDIYETITFTLSGSHPPFSFKPDLYFEVRAGFVGVYSSRLNTWMETYPFRFDTNGSDCITTEYTIQQIRCRKFYSSIQLGNGKTYSNATLFLRYIKGSGYTPGTHMPPNPAQTKCLWSPGLGIVQFESPPYDTTNYQLLRYNVKMRP